MTVALTVWANDLRNIVRDRTVGVLLLVPFILVAVLRFGLPLLEQRWTALDGHDQLVLGLFCIVVGLFPAFMASFIMLDERDQGLYPVFRILPVGFGALVRYRLAAVTVLGVVGSLVLLVGAGIGEYSVFGTAVLAAVCAAGGPAAMFVAVSLSGNKIECLTVFKVLFVLSALGITGALGELHGWNAAWAVLPTYWVFRAFGAAAGATTSIAANAAVAMVVYLCIAVIAYRRLRRLLT
ncbi:hypothetical protein C5142_06360 [Rhodococcus sp. BGS-1C]|jgi:fluoroquinolone transport system permease protein|uniref:hypothetical protein n=1 Tax=unclassified Rhodococcus (in: high G+C Gram-positive bacteria) TaxID=192944 RepID=UPI0019D24FA6|nr:hypothetical protein [Rhodococcus sp. KRD197]